MYERFEELLKDTGKTAYKVSKDTGISTATLTSWKQGKYTPKPDKLKLIADYFGVQIEYLIGESEYKTKEEMFNAWDAEFKTLSTQVNDMDVNKKGVKIPVLGRVAAGIPVEAIEDILDWEEITEDMAKTGKFFALQIKGDSMSPKILEDDVVIVRQQSNADSGDIVIAIVNGYDGCCKKLIKNDVGITLQSLNPNYEPMVFTSRDIVEKPVAILGKVVELRRKFL